MLQGINIFDFFESKENRRWNKADVKEYTVTFENGEVPPFIVVAATAALTVDVTLVNELTGEEEGTYNIPTVDSTLGYKIIAFEGATILNLENGYYSIELNINGVIYYSEVFGFLTNPDALVRFRVSSENVTLGGVHSLPFPNIVNTFYLFWNGASIEAEIVEEGDEKPYGDIPLFSTLNIIRTLSINGTAQIFRYLSALRIFKGNGDIEITIDGETRGIYDPRCEIEQDDSFGVTVQLNFFYRENDFVSVRNEI